MACERPDASRHLSEGVIQTLVHHDVREVMVIQAGTAKLRVVHIKAQRLDQVQHGPGTCRQTDRSTRIPGDFRLPKNNVQHNPQAW